MYLYHLTLKISHILSGNRYYKDGGSAHIQLPGV